MDQTHAGRRQTGAPGRRLTAARRAPHAALAAGLLALGAGSAWADNCEAIKAGIETRMRAGGLGNVVLAVTEPGEARPAGRVLGSCSQGSRQIVLTSSPVATAVAPPGAGAAPGAVPASAGAPARSAAPADAIPTECKDGSIVIGPDCNDPRAVRMTRTEIDRLQAEQAERADKARAERAARAASSS